MLIHIEAFEITGAEPVNSSIRDKNFAGPKNILIWKINAVFPPYQFYTFAVLPNIDLAIRKHTDMYEALIILRRYVFESFRTQRHTL